MVSFVDMFDSQPFADWTKQRGQAETDLKRQFPNDSDARKRELDRWTAAHPRPKVTIANVIDHIEHVRKVAGIDHIGIGSDFDGIETVIEGLEDVSTFPALFTELARRGWTEGDLRKLAGENVLRIIEQAERVAARLQRTRTASLKTIRELDGKQIP
jgi:membrane dipeptidase